MYEVMVYMLSGRQHVQVESTYQGDNWVKALGAYHIAVALDQHAVLWENNTPVREFFPGVGHEPHWSNCPTCHGEHLASEASVA